MMRLSREADYGLLALMYIAEKPGGQLVDRREIAAHYNIPPDFLAKVLRKLSRGGLIRSFRGTGGGYLLAREAGRISLADVVEAVEGGVSLVECQRDRCLCPQEAACTVQTALDEVRAEIRDVLGSVSLQDIRRRLKKDRQPRLIPLETVHR